MGSVNYTIEVNLQARRWGGLIPSIFTSEVLANARNIYCIVSAGAIYPLYQSSEACVPSELLVQPPLFGIATD
jgi:hypothetical protein